MSSTQCPPRVRLKDAIHVLEHPTGLCARLTEDSPPTLSPWQCATWFPSRKAAEDALAELGPAPLEIVRVDA